MNISAKHIPFWDQSFCSRDEIKTSTEHNERVAENSEVYQ